MILIPNGATTDKHGVDNLGMYDRPGHLLDMERGVDCSSANHNGLLKK